MNEFETLLADMIDRYDEKGVKGLGRLSKKVKFALNRKNDCEAAVQAHLDTLVGCFEMRMTDKQAKRSIEQARTFLLHRGWDWGVGV